jgi:dihydroorotate dehydrogenase electron transfer subunit
VIRKLLAPVLRVTPLAAPNHYVLAFAAGEMARDARPGHFLAVAPPETGTQILRRPFSFFTTNPATGEASILFSVYGPTTRAMTKLGPGDVIDVIGPLGGRIFAADERPGAHHIMVGGGYGVPPLAFLARQIRAADPQARVTFINGARTRDFLVGTDGLAESGVDVHASTNDGSAGYKGLVTDLLHEFLHDRQEHIPVQVYTCGPTPMMRAVGEMAIRFDVPCQVSLEVFMPCGIGICMGCAVGRPDGTYARGCTEGPVFEAREVVWP